MLPFPARAVSGDAQFALRRGQDYLSAGNQAGACMWLDRAHRMAPRDAMVRLLLASALIGLDEARCQALLGDLLTEYPDFREARIALIAARVRTGDKAAAGCALSDLLRCFAPPDNAGFRRLADTLARAATPRGWIGADASGRVAISLLRAPRPSRLEMRLDDRLVLSFRHAGRASARLLRTLPARWQTATRLTASLDGAALLGSPIELATRRRVVGFVEAAADGGLSGWAWHPADPGAAPELALVARDRPGRALLRIRADDPTLGHSSADGPVRRRGFTIAASRLPKLAALRIIAPDGIDIFGSPVFPFAEARAAQEAARALREGFARRKTHSPPADLWRPLPVVAAPSALARRTPPRKPVDVVIPVYRGAADFRLCLASVQRQLPDWARVVVVDDGSPDGELRDEIAARRKSGEIVLLRHTRNRGFPAAANTAMRHAVTATHDVVLLNADTMVPQGWLARLAACAYARDDIGSVTPMTNNGTIVSYPRPDVDNPAPDLAATDRLDQRLRRANRNGLVDLPTAVGFCMFIRHDCLAEVGLFREDAFAQGYGEENDWSLRARHLGWRHVAATGIFVTHAGGRSFGAGRQHLLARNAAILNRLHPGYDALIADFVARDPLRPARFRADARAWAEQHGAEATAPSPSGATILISHAAGGGVGRFVAERCARLQLEGRRTILLRPFEPAAGSVELSCLVSDRPDDDYPNLRFRLPQELDGLLAFLQANDPRAVEIHHLLGHAPSMASLVERLDLPYRVFIHDYGFWCPRITLCTKGPRYCGEPLDPGECEACLRDTGRRAGEAIPVVQFRAEASRLLRGAASVVVSCEDVSSRMARHFRRLRTTIIPWEDDAALKRACQQAAQAAPLAGPYRVLVVGAIGADKGYDVLLGCVRDAARRGLNLYFTVVGYTADDTRLIEAGPIFITGAFEEAEAVSLAAAQHAHIGFVPSIWPETWCYALSTIWRAGVPALAFALGAQAQRISRTGLGSLLPVGLAPERINDTLIRLAAGAAPI